jgi:hypothetical protein
MSCNLEQWSAQRGENRPIDATRGALQADAEVPNR